MITGLKYEAKGGVIVSAKLDQKDVSLRFDQILPYWDYANQENLEGGFARAYGNKVLLTMLTASTQDGVIILWDAEQNQVEHISDGSYVLACDMDEHNIYYLLDVFNYTTKANLQLWKIPIGALNAAQEGERVRTEQLPSADFLIEDYNKYAIRMHDDCVDVELDEKCYTVNLV